MTCNEPFVSWSFYFAICDFKFFRSTRVDNAIAIDSFNSDDIFPSFSPKSAGVHRQCATQSTGNSCEKSAFRKMFSCAIFCQLGAGDACFSAYLPRSEEHTSELQSLRHLVCRLLLE